MIFASLTSMTRSRSNFVMISSFVFACILGFGTQSLASSMAYLLDNGTESKIQILNLKTNIAEDVPLATKINRYPSLSADGSFMVFVGGEKDDQLDLYYYEFATRRTIQLTTFKGSVVQSRLSGDGKYLAASAPIGPQGRYQIFTLDLTEVKKSGKVSEPKVIASDYSSYYPTLNSSGDRLIFNEKTGAETRQLVDYNLMTNQRTIIATGLANTMSAMLSKDDGKLAFTAKVEGNWDVYIMDLKSKVVSKITSDAANDFAPTFADDGSLIFSSNRINNIFGIYKISSKELSRGEAALQTIKAGEYNLYAPSVSGDLEYVQRESVPFSEPARSSFGGVVADGKIFIVGGHQGHEHTYPPESFLDRVEFFDPSKGTWTVVVPRLHKAHGFQLAAWGKYIYAFGGFAYSADHKPKWKSLDVVERYNIEENSWEIVGHMATPRSSNVVAQIGNKVWIMGGWNSTPKHENDAEGRFLRNVELFNLETAQFEPTNVTIPDPLRRAFTGVVHGNEIYLIGGISEGASHFNLLDKVTVFNTATQTWREDTPLPFATFAPAAGMLDGKLYMFGGMYKMGAMEYLYVNHIYRRELNGEWNHTSRYLAEPKGFSQVLAFGANQLVILGGHHYRLDGNDAPLSTMEVFGVVK